MTRALALLAGAYCLGSVSFSLVVVWVLRRVDVRTLGSGNAGATNVLRAAGRWPALLVLLLDVAKGILPVQAARRLGAPPELVAGSALAAILGHVFPLFFGFRGGKGVATGFGAFVALFPLAGGAALALWVVVVAATRYVSIGSMVAAASVPAWVWGLGRFGVEPPPSPAVLLIAVAGAATILARHRSNLRRLAAGSERRLGRREAA